MCCTAALLLAARACAMTTKTKTNTQTDSDRKTGRDTAHKEVLVLGCSRVGKSVLLESFKRKYDIAIYRTVLCMTV